MIHAFFDATIAAEPAGDEASTDRTIRGIAVPWNRDGRVSSGQLVRFLPGALDAAARPVVALGHDSGRPVGRVVDNTSTDAGMATVVRVSRVREGDEALVLAADGVLGMFSVGVDPTEFTYEQNDDGEQVLVVAAGDWQHLALLPYGAFEDAVVTDVAASAPTQEETNMPEPTGTVITEAPAPVEAAPSPPPQPVAVPLSGGVPAGPPLTLSAVAQIIAAGNQEGLRAADVAARIQAALTNVISSNVPSVPNYRTELVGLIDHGTPLVNRLDNRPLPPTGSDILYPKWTALPAATAKVATEKTAIPSGAVSWAWQTTSIETWAQGNDLSLQAVQRSNPSAMDAYLRAAAVDAARKWDVAVSTKLLAAAAVATPGADFLANVAALFAMLDPTACPPGRVFLALSWDVAQTLIPIKSVNGPAFWSGSLDLGNYLPSASAAGMDIFVDPNLPVKTMLMGIGSGAATYGGSSLTDIRVVDVSLLGVDVGVYFFAASAVEYPGAFAKLTLP